MQIITSLLSQPPSPPPRGGARHRGLAPARIPAHDPHTAMTTLQAIIPYDIHEAVLAEAGHEHISVDALVSRTLRAAVVLPLLGLTVQERADRVIGRISTASCPDGPARSGG